MTDAIDRRRFLKVLGVTGAGAAALSSCGIGPEPTERLIPYLIQPEDQIPGTATYYATTCRECAAGCGVRVRVREGRAVKLEGNPDSPINRGRLCARGQAAIQGLYNPDRVAHPLVRNGSGTFEDIDWDGALQRLAAKVREAQGKGIVFLTGAEQSTFGDLVDEWMKQVGGRRMSYEAFGFEALRAGNRMAFGTATLPTYDFANAKYVLSFGADFLDTWLSPVEFQNGFSRAHAFDAGRPASMAKFTYVGPRLSLTGMNADEWIAPKPGSEGLLALAMAQVIMSQHLARVPADASKLVSVLAAHTPRAVAQVIGIDEATIARLAREFARSGGGLAVAGGMATQAANGAEIVAAVNILNYVVGAVGTLVKFGADLGVGATNTFADLATLTSDMTNGRVALLFVHGTNPAHSLPGAFQQALGKVAFKVSFSSYMDETAAACDLILPDHHPLEQWGDSRPRAGLIGLQQPVVQPVFGTQPTGDVILKLSGRTGTFLDYLQAKWRARHAANFDQYWMDSLAKGGVYGEAPTRPVRLATTAGNFSTTFAEVPSWGSDGDQTVVVFPHPALHDGRGANKPWLQELPDPVSKIAWHSWVEVHPDTAAKWGLSTGDFREALAALLGDDAAGLSATNIARLTNEWETEYRAFQKWSLAGRDYVYVWVDGVHFNVRLEDDRLCTLVMIGVRPDGTKELIAVEDGYRESAESWKTVLRDLKRWGMRPPVVAVGDGALGFWAAVRDVWPKTREQRDWFHKLGNILDKLPKRLQPRVKAALHGVMYAENREQAREAAQRFATEYGAKYPKAVATLEKDADVLVTFFDFPAEH